MFANIDQTKLFCHVNHQKGQVYKTFDSYHLEVEVEVYMFCLVWFYGISTVVGYLMPNPVFTYISNI